MQKGFSAEFLEKLQKTQAGDYITELAYRRGGVVTFRNLAELEEPFPALSGGKFEVCKQTLLAEGIPDLMAVSLQTREHNFGVLLFPHAERRMFGSSNLRLLIGLALQIALTLENYVVMHEAQRRTRNTSCSQKSVRPSVLTSIRTTCCAQCRSSSARFSTPALSTSPFSRKMRFVSSWRSKAASLFPSARPKISNGLTEHIIRTGEPLLIEADFEEVRSKLGLEFMLSMPTALSVPFLFSWAVNRWGVMAALSTERESSFNPGTSRSCKPPPPTGSGRRECPPLFRRAAPLSPSRIS